MDEFFNFDYAAHLLGQSNYDSSQLTSGSHNCDLHFAEPETETSSFPCLQYFSGNASEQQLSDRHNTVQDAAMVVPEAFTVDDFTDFPRWIEGMNVPSQPCDYCHRMHIHCKVIKEGHRRGSCTSCVALERSCSFTHNPPADTLQDDSYGHFEKICVCLDAAKEDVEAPEIGNLNVDDSINLKGNRMRAKSLVEEVDLYSHKNTATYSVASRGSTENLNTGAGESDPKASVRFSRESVRILKNWLSTHHRHPYPTDEEKESLRRQTSLNKVQITNWLANARRRGKVRGPRSISPHVNNHPNIMDIPRRGTPALQEMNPLERWKVSPPEHEPASITAISKAVTSSVFSSSRNSPYASGGHTDDGSNCSLCNVSSTCSLGTSHSSRDSFASSFSHKSLGLLDSFGTIENRGRRRRRRPAPKSVKVSNLAVAARTFQCTFCTETFKTKHDWQRHEKSLHLSLDRWICSPNGPHQPYGEWNHLTCVYCGLPNPPEGHAEQHSHSNCAEKSLEERTFYRKDHLRQHLNLVHNVKFQGWSMDSWKVAIPEIRSRCGFCGITIDSWGVRVDHLAKHFKDGRSMADWKGDWGFEPQVLGIVENEMPPHLIHNEQNTTSINRLSGAYDHKMPPAPVKHQNSLTPANENRPNMSPASEAFEFDNGSLRSPLPEGAPSPRTLHLDLGYTGIGHPSPVSGSDEQSGTGAFTPNHNQPLYALVQSQPSGNPNPTQPLRYFLNDANCCDRLMRELTRFVASCLSPNNPNQHIPSDAEIQNQARWVIYDDDDPLNRTAADNSEWLTHFKQNVGLAPSKEGPEEGAIFVL